MHCLQISTHLRGISVADLVWKASQQSIIRSTASFIFPCAQKYLYHYAHPFQQCLERVTTAIAMLHTSVTTWGMIHDLKEKKTNLIEMHRRRKYTQKVQGRYGKKLTLDYSSAESGPAEPTHHSLQAKMKGQRTSSTPLNLTILTLQYA